MARELHPAAAELLEFFDFDHLPPTLQVVSQPFHALAHRLTGEDMDLSGAELTVALRKLVESKDAAVRAAVQREKRRRLAGEAPAP